MDYANRDFEYSTLRKYLLNGTTPICIDAYHASGVTSFVKKRMHDVFASLFDSNIFYIHVSTEKLLSEALLIHLVQPTYLDKIQKFVDKKWGEHTTSVWSAALEGIPYMGSVLGRLTEQRVAVPLYTGVYASAMDEIIIQFFEKNNYRFLIVLDAVELLSQSSFDLLTKLLKIETVQCILIRTEENLKLENYLFENDIDLSACIKFDRPQVKLIKELGALYNITLSTEEASSIIVNTKQNIHEIIKEIRNIKKCAPCLTMTPWEKATIFVLQIWNNPLQENILFQIISDSKVFSLNANETFKETIYTLQYRGFIEKNSQGWILIGRHNPQIQKIVNHISDQLFYKNVVYQFLSRSNNEQSNPELRYKLSKELNCTTSNDAKAYLRQCIICGKEVTQELIHDAQLSKDKTSDCLLAGIKYCRERKYKESFMWINSIPQQEMTSDIEALRAALLNRIRNFEEAEISLLRCLQNSKQPAHQNILGSFLISTYIHMERLKDAQAVYEKMKDLFPRCSTHGYLIRNAISAFSEYHEELYSQALDDFRSEQDDFGYYTTLCNQGYGLCKIKEYHRALVLLEKARNGLETFPQSNYHIIYNNLGICYFLLSRYQEAYQYFYLALQLGQNSMPRIFSTINLACLEAVTGNIECAINRLNSIEYEVENHKLDRVRQKFYINSLFVEFLHGTTNIMERVQKVLEYPDRYFPEQTMHAIRIYENLINCDKKFLKYDWRDLYSPCGLVYWYMDPLKLLSEGVF